MPYKWNPLTSTLDYYFKSDDALSAQILVFDFQAEEPVSALKAVYESSNDKASISNTLDPVKAVVAGIAYTGANTGEFFRALSFGIMKDPTFNFARSEPLFISESGEIITAAQLPTQTNALYETEIGHGLGAGKIYVTIKPPITLAH